MRRIIICISIMLMFSCEKFTKNVKHIQSGWTGLDRRITLYGCDGEVIRVWEGKFMIELNGASAAWIDDNNKEIKISGSFVIEEL